MVALAEPRRLDGLSGVLKVFYRLDFGAFGIPGEAWDSWY
jgi:hypothetical protein